MIEYKEVVLVKLGGSVITKKGRKKQVDADKIKQLATEIHSARQQTDCRVVLSHGGGSFGHPPAEKYQTIDGIREPDGHLGVAIVRQAMIELNELVIKYFVEAGEPAITFSPVSFLTTQNKTVKNLFLPPLINLLRSNLLPVMHGDVLTDETLGCTIFSGEQLLNLVALRLPEFDLRPKLVIEIGKTEGVYDSKGGTIKLINRSNFEAVSKKISASSVTDVTGGMKHKVEEAYALARMGIPTFLTSAAKDNLREAILGKDVLGTWIRV